MQAEQKGGVKSQERKCLTSFAFAAFFAANGRPAFHFCCCVQGAGSESAPGQEEPGGGPGGPQPGPGGGEHPDGLTEAEARLTEAEAR